MTAQSQDLQIEKSITVGANFVSKTDTSTQGARERTASHTPAANVVLPFECPIAISFPDERDKSWVRSLTTQHPSHCNACTGKNTIRTT